MANAFKTLGKQEHYLQELQEEAKESLLNSRIRIYSVPEVPNAGEKNENCVLPQTSLHEFVDSNICEMLAKTNLSSKVDASTQTSDEHKQKSSPHTKSTEDFKQLTKIMETILENGKARTVPWDSIKGYNKLKQDIDAVLVLPRIIQHSNSTTPSALISGACFFGSPGTGNLCVSLFFFFVV